MPVAGPKRQKEKSQAGHHASPILTMETTGLIVIAILILAVMLARYWHFVHWSLR